MASSKGSVFALNNAVRRGDKDLVVKLLDQGVDPNQFDDWYIDDKTPLMVACENGRGEIAEILIVRGANVDLENEHHQTALSLVVASENVEMTRLLLKHKAKVRFDHGDPAMITACRAGNMDLVKLLVPCDTWNDSRYVYDVLFAAMSNGHTKVVDFLLESEHVEFTVEQLVNLLHSACKVEDDPEMVKIVLNKKPDIVDSTLDRYAMLAEKGFTALMHASAKGHIKVVNLLLDRGAEIDYQSEFRFSALMIACMAGKLEIVELLLKRGAKVDLSTKTGKTALMLSTISGYLDLNLTWASKYTPPPPNKSVEIIRLLLSKGASLDFQDDAGGTALMYAVKDRLLEAVKLLLDKKARVDIGTDREGTPPLHSILPGSQSYPVNAEIARLLLERGAPVDLEDRNMQTPLIVACCQAGKAELSKLLIKKGAKIDHLDNEGGYALLYAVRYAIQNQNLEVFEIIELLLEKGAKADIKADNGESALSVMKNNAAVLLVSHNRVVACDVTDDVTNLTMNLPIFFFRH